MSFSQFSEDDDRHDDDMSSNGDDDEIGEALDPEDAVADASPQEQEALRHMLGEALTYLSDDGTDVEELAEKAGIDSVEVDELTDGDIATLTQYLARYHVDAIQAVAGHFPAAQGVLSAVTGGQGGVLGGMLGRMFGRG